MESKKVAAGGGAQAVKGQTFDSAYGFSFSIALGLILFIAGLVVILALGDDNSPATSLVFGLPLLIGGLIVPLFMMRGVFKQNEIKEPCPYCGTALKTTDHTLRLECPSCHHLVAVQDEHLHTTE